MIVSVLSLYFVSGCNQQSSGIGEPEENLTIEPAELSFEAERAIVPLGDHTWIYDYNFVEGENFGIELEHYKDGNLEDSQTVLNVSSEDTGNITINRKGEEWKFAAIHGQTSEEVTWNGKTIEIELPEHQNPSTNFIGLEEGIEISDDKNIIAGAVIANAEGVDKYSDIKDINDKETREKVIEEYNHVYLIRIAN